MTHLARRKSRLVFATSDTSRYRGKLREVIIEVSPYIATCRLAGTRTRFEVSWAGIYEFAARIHADKQRAERKARGRR
jgi:hypothetical protein